MAASARIHAVMFFGATKFDYNVLSLIYDWSSRDTMENKLYSSNSLRTNPL